METPIPPGGIATKPPLLFGPPPTSPPLQPPLLFGSPPTSPPPLPPLLFGSPPTSPPPRPPPLPPPPPPPPPLQPRPPPPPPLNSPPLPRNPPSKPATAALTNTKTVPEHSVVTQHLYDTLVYIKGKQPFGLYHCVQKVFISPFYGEFNIYDKSHRFLGKSKNSELSFLKPDLSTECAKVWHDAFSFQGESATLMSKHKVQDPGLYFAFGDVFFEFEDAPDSNTKQTYWHIPVFFNVTNLWDINQKQILFK